MTGSKLDISDRENPEERSEEECCDLDDNEPSNWSKINTDGKKPYDWTTRYSPQAHKKMKRDALLLLAYLVLALFLLAVNYFFRLANYFVLDEASTRTVFLMANFGLSGMLGGTVFWIKYFYRVVPRGYWTEDRFYWRLFSPLVALVLGLVVGSMMFAGVLGPSNLNATPWSLVIGFFAGYFADEAVGKMYEVDILFFGRGPERRSEK